MKKAILFILLFAAMSHSLTAQCKPDVEQNDKFTGATSLLWSEEIYESPFINTTGASADVSIYMCIGKSDSNYLILIQIKKTELNMRNAILESSMKPDKNTQVILAFNKGKPIGGTVDYFVNNSKMHNPTNSYITDVVLNIFIKKEDLPAFKKALLESGGLDAIRIKFSDGHTIDKNIKERKSKKMQEKFQCFFDYLDNPNQ